MYFADFFETSLFHEAIGTEVYTEFPSPSLVPRHKSFTCIGMAVTPLPKGEEL
jgi:hypothetical protein